jgi:cobalamin biosynthesis protein CobT
MKNNTLHGEELVRKYIRKKISGVLVENKKRQLSEEKRLRQVIRSILLEGDISDMHPHRSTGINVLEDVLKKMITTLRTDYKRMTTSKSQRESFRAHMISAVKKALAPSLVNDTYLQGTDALMAEPTPEFGGPNSDEEVYGDETETQTDVTPQDETEEEDDLESALSSLEEADIQIDIEDEEKKIPVEDDDEPDEKEEFSGGLSDLDETGRNMAFTTFKKVSQYILDAYDMLANVEDKKIFVDYLITNMKLYFDKFEDEIQKEVSEPSTSQYDSMKN